MKLVVIILNYNTKDLLENCINSVLNQQTKERIKVVVVDNNSSDQSASMVEQKFPQVEVIKSSVNGGYSTGNNLALKSINGDNYLLLNSDTVVSKGALQILLDIQEKHLFGIISCELINKDGTFQSNFGDLPFGQALWLWLSGLDDYLNRHCSNIPSFHKNIICQNSLISEVGWVSGTAMMIKKSVIEKIGYLDEKIFMYGEDVEYCFRAKQAGIKIGWTPQAQIIHLSGGSLEEPKYYQWLGEFKGLIYIYSKYLGKIPALGLKLFIYLFVLIRIVFYFCRFQFQVSNTYTKILLQL